MMSEQESTQKDEVLDPIKYINAVIEHINNQIEGADKLIEKQDYIGAEKIFTEATSYYENRKQSLSQFKLNLCVPSLLDLDNAERTLNTYHEISQKIKPLLEALVAKKDANEPIAKAQKEKNDLEEQKKLALENVEKNQTKFEVARMELEDFTTKLDKAVSNYETILANKDEKKADNLPETAFDMDMQILGAFIAALGVTAVAIAFVALNAAGLAMPGVVLAGFGVGTALLGASIFSSRAKDINEYSDNICSYLVTPTT